MCALVTGVQTCALPLLTNLAFILSGVLLVVGLRRAEPAVRRDPAIIGLAVLVLVVGIGRGLFHSFATRWAALADVIPIALFILFYLYLALRRFVVLPLRHCLLAIVIVLLLTVVLPLPFGFSVSTYGVALLALLGFGGFLHFALRTPPAP